MKFAISQTCTLPGSFADDLHGYADGGLTKVEVWLTKLEQYLEKSSPAELQELLQSRSIELVAAAYQGGLLLSQGEQRQVQFEQLRRRLELCQTFRIPVLLILPDFAQRPDQTSLQRAMVSLKQAAQWASGYGVSLGLEFRGSDSFCACLDTALTLVESVNEPNVGVCFDLYHYYKGPSKTEDLARLTAQNLVHVQVCDVPGVPRELMTDADRVLPGEGDFHLVPLMEQLQKINYQRAVSVELFNPTIWQCKPSQVAELALASLQRLISTRR